MEQTKVEFVVLSTSGETLNLSDTTTMTKHCRRILFLGASTNVVTCTLNGVNITVAGGVELNSLPIESLELISGEGILAVVINTPKVIFNG